MLTIRNVKEWAQHMVDKMDIFIKNIPNMLFWQNCRMNWTTNIVHNYNMKQDIHHKYQYLAKYIRDMGKHIVWLCV